MRYAYDLLLLPTFRTRTQIYWIYPGILNILFSTLGTRRWFAYVERDSKAIFIGARKTFDRHSFSLKSRPCFFVFSQISVHLVRVRPSCSCSAGVHPSAGAERRRGVSRNSTPSQYIFIVTLPAMFSWPFLRSPEHRNSQIKRF